MTSKELNKMLNGLTILKGSYSYKENNLKKIRQLEKEINKKQEKLNHDKAVLEIIKKLNEEYSRYSWEPYKSKR